MHHIRHWARGGETRLENLVLLCSRHHRFVHEAGYSISKYREGGLEFRNPWGILVEKVPRRARGDPRSLVVGNADLDIDEGRCACGDGERMDLGLPLTRCSP